MNKRSVILSTFVLFCFGVLLWRLFDLMLLHHDKYVSRAADQQSQEIDIKVRRGIIYDRKGKEFATNLEQKSLYCNPGRVGSVVKTSYQLSGLTGIDRRKLVKKLREDKRFVWVKRKIGDEVARKIEQADIQGVGFIPESDRVYPRGKLASHVVGFVNIDNKGMSGIEKSYEDYLNSRGGRIRVSSDARGNKLLSGDELDSAGNSVFLTIDEVLQYIVENALDNAMARWKAKSATAIIMNPFSGEILAMANRPTFDPNSPGKFSDAYRRNIAISDAFEPGSTFKIVTASAVLEEKLFSVNSRFDCSDGFIEVSHTKIRDDHRNGILTFQEVIQKSSNVGVIMMAEKLGKEKLYKYAKKFGFGEKTGIDLPAEASGLVREPSKWSGISIGAVPIGQAVAATAIQVLRAYAAIANGGYLVTPFIVSRITSPEGVEIYNKQAGQVREIISPRTAGLLKTTLETVTREGGTALEASIQGNSVAGKTGTAQIFDKKLKRYSHEKFISSFVGFFPAEKPRLAMIVVITEPKGEIFGGKVAGPVFSDIADKALAYLNVPMDDSPVRNVIYVKGKNEAEKYY